MSGRSKKSLGGWLMTAGIVAALTVFFLFDGKARFWVDWHPFWVDTLLFGSVGLALMLMFIGWELRRIGTRDHKKRRRSRRHQTPKSSTV